MPLINKNGSFLAMKGNVEEELTLAKDIMKKNNWYVNKKEVFHLPNKEDIRTILEIKNKAQQTSKNNDIMSLVEK